MAKNKCKHEWRQVDRTWSGSTDAKASFYCIYCLKITSHKKLEDHDFAKEVEDE